MEAAVNVPYIYVRNVIFGDDIDTATRYSFSSARFGIDAAAINWMIAENFRAGKQMDYSNTEYDEFRYQHRGYAKYPDMARLFGWQVISNMFRQENLDAMSGSPGPAAWLSATDQRTLKFSIAAGEDLTPLIHFWGIFPEDSIALKNAMESYGLYRSAKVKAQIERYASIVPVDQAAFIAHFDEVWPGKRDVTSGCGSILYGCGWYNYWYPKWNTTLALQTVAAVEAIVNLYWPAGDVPSSSPTSLPTPAPCLDTRTGSYCRRQKRNNKCSTTSGCDLTCGKCKAGRRGLLSSHALSTHEAETSPESKIHLRQSRDAREFGDGISSGGAASRQLAPPAEGTPGLSDGGPPGWDRARQRANLDESRGLWKRAALFNYTFELERDFFGPDGYKGPFVVTVRNGLVAKVVHKATGNPLNPAVAIDILTIDQMLDAIDSDIDNASVKYEHTKYDPFMGFPFDIFRAEAFVDFYNGERSEVAQTFVRNLTVEN